ncbi:MAG: hypothetical protein HY520_04895 [Candidatus Aenigmarchaeota archaeon]|nr:hypothetical protein [Candidatus Aenigmarchaeota archaeon]
MKPERPGKRKSKMLEKLAEEATVDCWTDEEVFGGWACTLEDELPLPMKCHILGEEAMLVGVEVDDGGKAVLGRVVKARKKIRVPVQDIEPADAKTKGLEWLEAYRHWLR